jgi:hypothetical protein
LLLRFRHQEHCSPPSVEILGLGMRGEMEKGG